MHHCNIDRLWASWNRNGGRNPTGSWLTKTFVFADENGNRVAAKVDDFKDLGALGYTYDRLEPAPPGFSPLAPSEAPPAAPEPVYGTTAAVVLTGKVTTATLAPRATGAGAPSFAERTRALSQTRRAYLVLRSLKAERQPGVLYNVYVNLPGTVAPSGANPHHAGALNFFDSIQHVHAGRTNDKFFAFDVTEVLRNLQSGGVPPAPTVTIAAVGQPGAGATPTIGEIALIEQ
jgi:tyrosinase